MTAGIPTARPRPAARARPGLVPHRRRPRRRRACRAPGTSSTTASSRPGRHPAVRARQPHLVLPVAPAARGGAARLAGGRPGPARHGLLRAARRPAHPRAAGRTTSATSPPPSASPGRWSPSATTGAARSRWAGRWRTATSCAAWCSATPPSRSPSTTAARLLIRLAHVPRAARALLRRAPRCSCARPRRCPARPCRATYADALAAPYSLRRAAGRPSATSSPTSRSRRDHPSYADRRRDRRGRPRRSTCPRCCCGARATRCSASATSPTCASGCRRPSCTATRAPRTWSPRTRRSTPTRSRAGSPTWTAAAAGR